jgi:hypothetical protein
VPVVTNNRQVSFWGTIAGAPSGATQGVFLYTDGELSSVAVNDPGQATPLGGTYAGFAHIPSPNDSGQVAFWAALSGSSADICADFAVQCAVFLSTDGVISEVIAGGDIGPAGVGGTINDLGRIPLINGSGQLTVWTEISNGLFSGQPLGQSLVRVTEGVMENVAAVGNLEPLPGTGAFSDFINAFGNPGVPAPNNLGQIGFRGELTGGTASEGIFVTKVPTGPVIEEIAAAGAEAPGTGGGTFGSNFDLDINSDGQAIFANTVTGGTAGVDNGIFLFFAGSTYDLALEGQDAPLSVGGSFETFCPPVSNDSGEAVARVTITGGGPGVTEGLYLFFAGSAISGTPETPHKLAAKRDPAPMPLWWSGPALFFAGFGEHPDINNAGNVVASVTIAEVDGSNEKKALYLFFAGAAIGQDPMLLCLEDDTSCPATDTALFFAGFAEPAINTDNQVVAKVILTGGADPEAVYLFFAGSVIGGGLPNPVRVAQEDQETGLGTNLFFAGFGEHPDINLDANLDHNVAYQATLKDASGPVPPATIEGEALFLFFAGSSTTTLLAKETDATPDGVPGAYGGFGDPAINTHNQVVAQAYITGGPPTEGLFLFFAGSAADPVDPVEITEIVLQGQDTPDGTETYGGGPPVFPYVAYNNVAQVVYVANLVGGSQRVLIASLDNDVGGGDGVLDFMDNCPAVFNTAQINTDKALAAGGADVVADDLGNACDDDIDGDFLDNLVDPCVVIPDCDGDGFNDGLEVFMGTDSLEACSNNSSNDALPFDTNKDKVVNLVDLVGSPDSFKISFGSSDGEPNYRPRFDWNGDGAVNLIDLVGARVSFKNSFATSCGNGTVRIDETGDGPFELTSAEEFHFTFDETFTPSFTWRVQVTAADASNISFKVTCPGLDEHDFDIAPSGGTNTITCNDGSKVEITVN